MLRVSPILATLLLASAATVSAEFKDFFFTSNATKYKCNGTGLVCKPPRICAYEPTIQMYYCCASGAIDAECWKLSPDCDGENESTPSGSQQSCSSGINAFCCLKTRETCTQVKDQINVCWSTSENLVANLSESCMNDTFSLLSSATPSASSFRVALTRLQALETPTASLSSASTLSSAKTTASVTETALTADPSSIDESTTNKSISGGGVGGIVDGVVGGLALTGIAGLLLFRRRKANSKSDHAAAPEQRENKDRYEMDGYQQQHTDMAEAPVLTEKYGSTGVPEVEGSPAVGQNVHEMPGTAPTEDVNTPVRGT